MTAKNMYEGRWNRIKRVFDIGVLVTVTLLLGALLRDRVRDILSPNAIALLPLSLLSLVLLVETVALVFFWYKAVSEEMQMLRDHLVKSFKALPKESYQVTVGLAILLGGLGYFFDSIAIYSAIFVLFKLLEIWALRARNLAIKEAISEERKISTSPDISNNLTAIENYYFNKPQAELAMTSMFFSFAAFVFGLIPVLLPTQSWMTPIAYIIMILTIAIPEFIYGRWRTQRDLRLGESYS